jgi:hypothetical protein
MSPDFKQCLIQAKKIVDDHKLSSGCDPQAGYLTATAIGLAIASAAIGAYTSYQSGQAQKDAAKYNAKVATNNADAAVQQAQFDAQQIRSKNKRILAAQKAIYSGSGIDLASGSSGDVAYDSSIEGEMDALKAIYTGQTNARSFAASAALDKSRASNAETIGNYGAAGSILGGASSATGIYADYVNSKPPKK